MSESSLPADSAQPEMKPRGLSLGRQISVAFEQTIRADGLFLVFLVMISLGLALLVTSKWEKADWKATAALRIVNTPREGGNGFSAPEVSLLVSNVLSDLQSPEKLEVMNAALGQTCNTQDFKRAILAMGESAALQWTANDKQAALLALELMSQQVKWTTMTLAKELHQKNLANWSGRIAQVEARLAELRKTEVEFHKTQGIVDVKGDLAALSDSITSLEYQLRLDLQAEVGMKEQYKEVLRQLDDAKRVSAMAIEREMEEKSSQASEKDLIKARQVLRDAIQAEKAQLEKKALIDNKVNEKKQLEALAAQGKASPQEVLRLETEIQVLRAKIAGNQKIADMERELKSLEQATAFNGEKKGKRYPTSPAIVALLDKKMDAELKMLGLTMEKSHLLAEIEAAKAKRGVIQSAEGKEAEYRQEKDRLVKEKESLHAKKQEAEWNGAERTLQVEWVQTPAIGDQPVSTNRYQLFSSVFLCSSLFGFLGTFVWELGKSSSVSDKRNLVWRRPKVNPGDHEG